MANPSLKQKKKISEIRLKFQVKVSVNFLTPMDASYFGGLGDKVSNSLLWKI